MMQLAAERLERYRALINASEAIAFSFSYQKENLLSRGLGWEHLRELLLRLAQPLLRTRANIAYAGHWENSEYNLIYDLLQLITDEKEDKEEKSDSAEHSRGHLYNYSAWPHYLRVKPEIEAQWINSCRIVRITQEMAGIPKDYIVPDSEAKRRGSHARLNAALTLSEMRRLMMGMKPPFIQIPDVGVREFIPPVTARIFLGGKLHGYSGFLPGLFEEALVSLRRQTMLFILGGFGGAAEVLARAVTDPDGVDKDEFTIDTQLKRTPALGNLLNDLEVLDFKTPPDFVPPEEALKELKERLKEAQLFTGLGDKETDKLLLTSDIHTAVRLVKEGLTNQHLLPRPEDQL